MARSIAERRASRRTDAANPAQPAGPPEAGGTQEDDNAYGSPDPADARGRDEAADLSRGRGRRTFGARQPSDRDDRSLQPADRPDRAEDRRREGVGLAGQGRPAVRHRAPSPPHRRDRPGREEVGPRWQQPNSSNTSRSRSWTTPTRSRSRSSAIRAARSSSCVSPTTTWAR